MSRRATPATPRLSRGDTVGVVATGFAVPRASLEAGLARLRAMGYRVVVGEHVLHRNGYLAGDDDARATDLRAMLSDPEVRAVWFARGGYGTARLLDRVPWAELRRHPKLLVGYSDLTALFCPAVERSKLVCLYGPVVSELGERAAYHERSLRDLLAGRTVRLRFTRRQVLSPGASAGRLVGGNLSVLTHLCGTRYAPDLRGAILFLEEVGEAAYRIDRMLTQLRQSGALRGLAGVLLGAFSVPPRRRFPPDRPLAEILGETFLPLGVPVVTDVPAGHTPGKWTLPIGGTVELDCARGELHASA